MALTKASMAEKLYDEIGLNKRESKDFVESFFYELNNMLENGKRLNYLASGISV